MKLLFFLGCCFVAAIAEDEDSRVLDINESEFDELINANEFVLVNFCNLNYI